MKARPLIRRAIFTASAVIALILAMAVSPAAASEVAPGNDNANDAYVSVPMQLDCVNMTDEAREYAREHNLCPAGKSRNDVVNPDGQATDTCGDAWMYVQYTGVRGYGSIDYGFNSSIGNVVYRNLAIGYAGSEYYGGWNDAGWMNDYFYTTGQVRYMGWGYAQRP